MGGFLKGEPQNWSFCVPRRQPGREAGREGSHPESWLGGAGTGNSGPSLAASCLNTPKTPGGRERGHCTWTLDHGDGPLCASSFPSRHQPALLSEAWPPPGVGPRWTCGKGEAASPPAVWTRPSVTPTETRREPGHTHPHVQPPQPYLVSAIITPISQVGETEAQRQPLSM